MLLNAIESRFLSEIMQTVRNTGNLFILNEIEYQFKECNLVLKIKLFSVVISDSQTVN